MGRVPFLSGPFGSVAWLPVSASRWNTGQRSTVSDPSFRLIEPKLADQKML